MLRVARVVFSVGDMFAPALCTSPTLCVARPLHKLTTALWSEQGGEQQPGALSPRCAAARRVPCLRAQHHRCNFDQLCVLYAWRVAQRRAAWQVSCARRGVLLSLIRVPGRVSS
jgi:hypothetical protein